MNLEPISKETFYVQHTHTHTHKFCLLTWKNTHTHTHIYSLKSSIFHLHSEMNYCQHQQDVSMPMDSFQVADSKLLLTMVHFRIFWRFCKKHRTQAAQPPEKAGKKKNTIFLEKICQGLLSNTRKIFQIKNLWRKNNIISILKDTLGDFFFIPNTVKLDFRIRPFSPEIITFSAHNTGVDKFNFYHIGSATSLMYYNLF